MHTHTAQLASLFIAPGGSWVVKFTAPFYPMPLVRNLPDIDNALKCALHHDLDNIRHTILATPWTCDTIHALLCCTHRPTIGYHTAVKIIVNVHIQLSRNCIDHYHPAYKATAALLDEFINQYSAI